MRHVVVAVLVALTSSARANVAAPWIEGGTSGEASGIGTVTIKREELTIDLRPAATVEPAKIRVVYHLDNPGDEKPLDLVFVSGSFVTKFAPTLDGKALEYTMSTPRDAAAPWTGPSGTPDFDGGEVSYKAEITPVGFHMTLPSGTHDLVIEYSARMGGRHDHEPTVKRQLVYILAPAKTWGGFGGLDITVHVPNDWRAIASLPLQRSGDTLTGSFATIPADALGITLQAKPSVLYSISTRALQVQLILVLIGGWFVLYRRANVRPHMTLSGAFGHGFLWATAVLVTGLLAIFVPDSFLPDLQADRRGYGDAFAAIGLVLLSVVVLVIGTIVTRVRSGRAAKARTLA